MRTCIKPSASAPSVPERIMRCWSAWRAVRVRYGSMQTMRAPRDRASFTSVIRLMCV